MNARKLTWSMVLAAAAMTPLISTASEPIKNARAQWMLGQPSLGAAGARVVDVRSTKALNVAYGETVVFVNGDKRFAWTFNGLDHRMVRLASVASPDFEVGDMRVYVGKDPSTRN